MSQQHPHFYKGRAAVINPAGRFETIEAFTDDEAGPPKARRTQWFADHSKTIVTHNDSPDVCITASVNAYRGCEHGCAYCFARPSHEYLGLSCGLDFETKLFAKLEAPKLLREKLASKSWQPQVITMSGITDCYQPIERKLKLTRQCLEVLRDFGNPVVIITKNHLVTRDVDILAELAAMQAAQVLISITTLDESLQQAMEPRTASPTLRLKAIETLSQAGIPVTAMLAPLIAGLNDHEINSLLSHVAQAGATTAHYTMLRLPYGVKDIFATWLQTHHPDRAQRVLNKLRDMHGGKLNDPRFGHRMTGQGPYADTMAAMFRLAKKRHGLNNKIPPLSIAHFHNPSIPSQLKLFS